MKRMKAVLGLALLVSLALALAFACTIGGGEDKSGGDHHSGTSDDADDDAGDDADDDAGDDDQGDDDDAGDDDDTSGCAAPTPDFDGSPRAGSSPLSVAFADLSQTDADCPITAWAWDFGDGGTSADAAPTHVYPNAGTYDVTLSVYNGASNQVTKPGYVVVSCGAPTAAFTASVTSGNVPLSVPFTNQTTAGCSGVSYHWEFGDGDGSDETNPTHVYLHPGTFTVTLIATTQGGQNVAARQNYITVACGGAVTADFEGSPLGGRAPLTVQFHQTGTGYCPNTLLAWSFGDYGTGTGTDPSHRYQSAGTYSVWLGVWHGSNSDQELKQGYVVVTRNGASLIW